MVNHNSDDLPEFGASGGPIQGPTGNQPGTANIFMQPTAPGSGMHSPIERLLRGTTNPQEFYALSNVSEEDVQTISRILYFSNLFNYGDGKLEECIWAQLQLRRAINGKFTEQIVQMVTGQHQPTDEGRSRVGSLMRNWREDNNDTKITTSKLNGAG